MQNSVTNRDNLVLDILCNMETKQPQLEDLIEAVYKKEKIMLTELEALDIVLKHRAAVRYCGRIVSDAQGELFDDSIGRRCLLER